MVLVKAGNHASYQYRSGCVYFSFSGANTVEAGYPGIPRSIRLKNRKMSQNWQ